MIKVSPPMTFDPFSYATINATSAAADPSTVHAHNTALSRFYQRLLLLKAISRLELALPDAWPDNYVRYALACRGFFAVIETREFGVVPQICTLAGYNIYRQPTRVLVANPGFRRTYDLTIGKDAEIVRLSPDYGGLWDIVSYYADLLAIASEALSINMLNSKLAYVFAAANKASAETFKKLFDQIASGNPAAVVDKQLFNEDGSISWQYFAQDLRNNFIAPELLQLMRMIETEFDTRIGIPNANTDKKERLIVDEVNANNVETYSLLDLFVTTIQEDFEKVNQMFGLSLSVKINNTAREVMEDDQGNTVNPGAL